VTKDADPDPDPQHLIYFENFSVCETRQASRRICASCCSLGKLGSRKSKEKRKMRDFFE
jgi:hypothetical protein